MSSSLAEGDGDPFVGLTAAYRRAKAAVACGDLAATSTALDEVDRILPSIRAGADSAHRVEALAAHADLLALTLASRDALRAELARLHEGARALRGYHQLTDGRR